ncbi:MAG: hypothetical protein Tsb0014_15760 [Pleurocapsa sp.]
MSANEKARALMSRHHHIIKNRQQSLLNRTASEFGIDVDNQYWSNIQGKPDPTFRKTYDRSNASPS